MAPKVAAMLTRSSRKVVVVLAYVFLEWALILLLLFNSFFSYMIRKFAIYFGLKQPCILCSRVDHLLDSAKTTDSYKSLVCEFHATEISKLGYCSNHQKFAESQRMCEECFSFITPKNVPFCQTDSNGKTPRCSCCEKSLSKKLHNLHSFSFRESLLIREIQEEKGEEEIENKVNDVCNQSGSECEPHILSDVGSFYLREAAEEDSNEDDQLNDHAESAAKQIENSRNEALSIQESGPFLLSTDKEQSNIVEFQHGSLVDEMMMDSDNDIFLRLKQLKSDLEAEQKSRNELYAEVEAERNAAAIAANQTMAMITRLQEEKATMQMEALYYQRVMEEQAEYDQQALSLLNELVGKREREKEELEKELDGYREKGSDYEAKEKAMMLIQKCSTGNFSSSCSIDNDSDVLSIDLNRQYSNKVEDSSSNDHNKDVDVSLMECSKQWGAIEDSLVELEEERMSIIKQLQELEEKLQKDAKQDEQVSFSKDEKEIEQNSLEDPSAELCSQEVNLVPCFSTSLTSENQPKTMASVARRLLDLVEADDDNTEMEDHMGLSSEFGFDRETESKRVAIEKEMNHVYGRLQALEADTEFLRHCIASVNNGNEGKNLLQEILQHLRELRDAEICL